MGITVNLAKGAEVTIPKSWGSDQAFPSMRKGGGGGGFGGDNAGWIFVSYQCCAPPCQTAPVACPLEMISKARKVGIELVLIGMDCSMDQREVQDYCQHWLALRGTGGTADFCEVSGVRKTVYACWGVLLGATLLLFIVYIGMVIFRPYLKQGNTANKPGENEGPKAGLTRFCHRWHVNLMGLFSFAIYWYDIATDIQVTLQLFRFRVYFGCIMLSLILLPRLVFSIVVMARLLKSDTHILIITPVLDLFAILKDLGYRLKWVTEHVDLDENHFSWDIHCVVLGTLPACVLQTVAFVINPVLVGLSRRLFVQSFAGSSAEVIKTSAVLAYRSFYRRQSLLTTACQAVSAAKIKKVGVA